MGGVEKDVWEDFCYFREIKSKNISHGLLKEWETKYLHIFMVYIRGNPNHGYQSNDFFIQRLIDSQDLDNIVLCLLKKGVDIPYLEAISDIWGITPLLSIPEDKFHFILESPYHVFKTLQAKEAFHDIQDEYVVYEDNGYKIKYKDLRCWECLIKVPWSSGTDHLFSKNAKKIRCLIEGLKEVEEQDEFESLLSQLAKILGLSRQEKKKLVSRASVFGGRIGELYFNYTEKLWLGRNLEDLEEEGAYGQIKNAIRVYLRKGVVGQVSIDTMVEHMPIVKDVFEGELRFKPSDANSAINQMLLTEREVFYQYLYKLSKNPQVRYYFLFCNRAFYSPSEDTFMALKNSIIDIRTENSYIKVRKLLGGIGFFLGMWAIFIIHDVAWMFAAIVMAFVLTWELLAVIVQINKQEEGFLKDRARESERIRNYYPASEISKPLIDKENAGVPRPPLFNV